MNPHQAYVKSLNPEEQLIILRVLAIHYGEGNFLYEGDWEEMLQDLRDRRATCHDKGAIGGPSCSS